MAKQVLIVMAILIVIGIALVGCSAPNPYTDADFGRSTAVNKAQQTLNPDASRNTQPVAGIDGKAAKGAMDSYRNSFRLPSSDMGASPASGAAAASQ